MDRTGDEIHTSMEAAPMVRKKLLKLRNGLLLTKIRNVAIGLAALRGKAQIGKGMWPKPDSMKDMLATKTAHPNGGADLHGFHHLQVLYFCAIHYQINV